MAAGQGFCFKMNTPTGVYKANEFFLDYYAVSLSKPIDTDVVEELHAGEGFDSDFMWSEYTGGFTRRSHFGITHRDYSASSSANYVQQIVDSGSACMAFPHFYPTFREYCKENDVQFRASRVDIAFDMIMERDEWRLLVDKAALLTREDLLPSVDVRYGKKDASTIMIGSRANQHKFIRIYNKSLQSPDYRLLNKYDEILKIPEDKYIIRFEVELKRVTAGSEVNGKKYKYEYTCDAYVDDLYSNPERLLEILKDIYKPVKEYFGLEIEGGVHKIKQNFYFGEYISDLGKKMKWVVNNIGGYIPMMTQEQLDKCVISAWVKFGKKPVRIKFVAYYDTEEENLAWLKSGFTVNVIPGQGIVTEFEEPPVKPPDEFPSVDMSRVYELINARE